MAKEIHYSYVLCSLSNKLGEDLTIRGLVNTNSFDVKIIGIKKKMTVYSLDA